MMDWNTTTTEKPPKLLDQVRNALRITLSLVRLEKVYIQWINNPILLDTAQIPMNKIIQLKVKYGEVHIGKIIRSVGDRWNREQTVWELPYRDVIALGLEDRIVKQGERSGR